MGTGIERLQLFVRFCNFCGLIPFRMVFDDETKQFKRFEGHWRHPANWWFALLLVGHILSINLLVYFNWKQFYTVDSSLVASLTFVHLFALALYSTNFIVLISLPRFFLIRSRNLETALETLDRIDSWMNKVPRAPCTTRRRTLIGFSLIFCFVRDYLNINRFTVQLIISTFVFYFLRKYLRAYMELSV